MPLERHEPRFEFYGCTVDGDQALIRVDVGHHDLGPDPERPHSLRVRVRLRDPRDDGLTQPEEAEVLWAFEEALTAALGPAPLVGVMTAGGARSWYFYSDDPERDLDRARAVQDDVIGTHEAEFGSFRDPGWEQYFGFLYPNALAWQFIRDGHVLAALRRQGDDGEAPRPIEHWAYLPTRKARRAFSKRVAEAGYRILGKSTRRGDDRPFGLHFVTAAPEIPADIFPRTEQLAIWATEVGGTYDGWEVQVVARARAEEEDRVPSSSEP